MSADFGYIIATYGLVPLVAIVVCSLVTIAFGARIVIGVVLMFFATWLIVRGFFFLGHAFLDNINGGTF